MSVYDLLTPLPKNWSNINVNSINVGSGGSNLQAPLTISGNTASGSPLVTIVETNATPNSFNVGLQIANQSGSAGLKLITENDPSPSSAIWIDGSFIVATFEPTGSIQLQANTTGALTCSYVSPGQTLTQIQNLTTTGNLLLPTTGGTASNLNYYEEYSAPFNFSGPWGATVYTRNISITRIGRNCTMRIDAIIQTASVGLSISSGSPIPARFRPSASADSVLQYFQIIAYDSNVLKNGTLRLDTNGNILILSQNNGAFPLLYTTYTGAGQTGFDNIFITYSV